MGRTPGNSWIDKDKGIKDLNLVVRTYGLFVFAWFIVNRLYQDSFWLFVVLDKFAEYFLVLSVPVLILAFFTRKALTVGSALLALTVTAFFYMPLLKPVQGAGTLEDNLDQKFWWQQKHTLSHVQHLESQQRP